jgi:ribosomal protein S18 acetylase RimI-like enzyme
MVYYLDSASAISLAQIRGFFINWSDPPSPEAHLAILKGSDAVELALDDETGRVVGFVTAVSDGVLCAYIPLLEVLPDYQDRGIGGELMRRMLHRLGEMYMIDLLCDEELQPFYERVGMQPAFGMVVRNYERQSGAARHRDEVAKRPQGDGT